MAIPTQKAFADMLLHGTGLMKMGSAGRQAGRGGPLADILAAKCIEIQDYFVFHPEPFWWRACGERAPFAGSRTIYLNFDGLDDGGGPALASYRFGECGR